MPDPYDYKLIAGTNGINMSYTYMTEERIQNTHKKGSYFGVWYDTDLF